MDSEIKLGSGVGASIAGWGRLGGFVLLVVTLVPAYLAFRLVSSPTAQKMPKLFHRVLSVLLGLRLRVRGKPADPSAGAVLFISNHSSYLDIPALGALIDGCFVAKSEVAKWPFIGGMSKLQNTVFIERRSSRAGLQRDVLRETIEDGKSLILFPEGTSSDGMRTLPFKSSLFSIAERPLRDGKKVRIQPVSLLCSEIGGMPIGRSWRPFYAWYGDMTLVGHAWNVFKIASFTVDVIFHEPVTIDDFGNRKLLSEYCQRKVAEGVDQCVTGRYEKGLAARA